VKWSLRGASALIVIISVAVVVFVAATIMVIRYETVNRSIDRVLLASRCRQLALNLAVPGDNATRMDRVRVECMAVFDKE
jgi:hypothetical protein